ncbi:hypothetical protein phiOC_p315 [Ochrobactrum phage vB_OspM_OC]|nr:hypothetical protein phiOC_p315 [Ochrobactrum phage vB_OspM_OC]
MDEALKKALKEFLKETLEVQVNLETDHWSGGDSVWHTVKVKLILDGEEITESSDSFSVPNS